MLEASKMKLVEQLVTGSQTEELIWLNGYIAGLLAGKKGLEQPVPVTSKPLVNKITIAFGTETGNSKRLASSFAAKAKKAGINAKIVDLNQYRLNDLQKEEYFITVVSTHGDGEPPAAAKKFFDHIHVNGSKLEKMNYGVIALGDSSYPLFCKAGEQVDLQLSKMGAQRLLPLQKCDVDYEADAEAWFDQVLKQLSSSSSASTASVAAPAVVKKSTGKKIYTGTVLTSVNLNDTGSNKETYHIEIEAEDVEYLPGDALGVVPENPQQKVEAIIKLLELDGEKKYAFRNEEYTAFDLLKKKVEIVYLPERVVSAYAGLVNQDIPATRISLLDLLKIYPLKNSDQFEQLVGILEPIAPRLYSISSSPEAHSGEVHITVARDKFSVNDEVKYGLCSNFLAQFEVGQEIQFYIHKNNQFRLPEEDKEVIMIGPGTGIAPFRSFIAHRDATGASGKNWLFFGDQHFVTDFLYQTEIQNWVETGSLSKIDLAFSRDQQEKVYVQHKMKKKGKELYEWLQNGATLYVCGAKEPMSVDVENALVEVVQEYGGKKAEEAVEFINQLKSDGRYLKDVY
ncbi:MAG TPA: flavodoxin domain-containing protein [Flavisolibacter sp.]|nr:flavodoxin domain-containing protein [Flavisolibacter sp.]